MKPSKSLLETNPLVELTTEMFPCMSWELDGVIFSIAPTWEMKDTVSFIDYKKDLQTKPHAKRDYGCIPTAPDSAYLPNPDLIEQRANAEREDPWDVVDQRFKDWFKPKQRDYFLHCDFSTKKDSTGIAMCHYEEKLKRIIVDLMIDLRVPAGGELILSRSRSIIYEIQRLGFNIYKLTLDSWNSVDSLQEFKRHGIKAEVFSVDKDTAAYDTMVDVIDHDMLDYYPHQVFFSDMRSLRLIAKGKKVDHVVGGSKDLSDAVAGCVYQAYLKMPKDYKPRSV